MAPVSRMRQVACDSPLPTALGIGIAVALATGARAEAPPQRLPSAVLIYPLVVVEGAGRRSTPGSRSSTSAARPVDLELHLRQQHDLLRHRLPRPADRRTSRCRGWRAAGSSAAARRRRCRRSTRRASSSASSSRIRKAVDCAQHDPGPGGGVRRRRADDRVQRGRLSAPDRRAADHTISDSTA